MHYYVVIRTSLTRGSRPVFDGTCRAANSDLRLQSNVDIILYYLRNSLPLSN